MTVHSRIVRFSWFQTNPKFKLTTMALIAPYHFVVNEFVAPYWKELPVNFFD